MLTPEDPLYFEIREDKLYFLMMASESESEILGSFPLTEFISSLPPVKGSKIIDKSIILNKIAPMRGGAKNAFRQIFLNLHLNKKIDRALLLKLAEILVPCIGTLDENKSMDTRLSLYTKVIQMIHDIKIDPEKKSLDKSPDPDTAARAAGSG
ncbi:MAG: hypothetical protein NTV32_08285 [Gammaproteobacteria bacterium]|nr:hypothetical protein [Gammaproteobacteria bacterium]